MRLIIKITTLFLCISLHAQDRISVCAIKIPKNEGDRNEIISFLNKKFYEELDTYCLGQNPDKPSFVKLTGRKFFKERLKSVFSTVVTTNANTVENGSAFAYVKDKDKNTLSVNGAVFIGKTLFDIGVSTKMEADDYKFYADQTWSNDITASIGISWVVKYTNTAGIKTDYLTKCDSLNQRRRQFVTDTLMPKYDKLYKWIYDPSLITTAYPTAYMKVDVSDEYNSVQPGQSNANDDLLKTYVAASIRIEKINDDLRRKFTFTPIVTVYAPPASIKETVTDKSIPIGKISIGTIKVDGAKTADVTIDTNLGEKTTIKEIKEIDLKKELAELIEIKGIAVELLRLRDNKDGDKGPVKKFVEKKFEKFDAKNDISVGYTIHWISFKTFLTNSSITVNNDGIVVDSIHKKIDNLFKLSLEASYNISANRSHFIYLKLFSRLNRSSLLDSGILKIDGFNVMPVLDPVNGVNVIDYTINDDNGDFIANYSELKHPVYNIWGSMERGYLLKARLLELRFKEALIFQSTAFKYPIDLHILY